MPNNNNDLLATTEDIYIYHVHENSIFGYFILKRRKTYLLDTRCTITSKYERLLLVSGLEYRENLYGDTDIKLYTMKDVDRHLHVLSLLFDIPIDVFKYNKNEVSEFFKG